MYWPLESYSFGQRVSPDFPAICLVMLWGLRSSQLSRSGICPLPCQLDKAPCSGSCCGVQQKPKICQRMQDPAWYTRGGSQAYKSVRDQAAPPFQAIFQEVALQVIPQKWPKEGRTCLKVQGDVTCLDVQFPLFCTCSDGQPCSLG